MHFDLIPNRADVLPNRAGPNPCTACGRVVEISWWFGTLISTCRRCSTPMGLNAGRRETQCLKCGEINLWPADMDMDETYTCFDCLKAGRVAITHTSELGIITWPDAVRGLVRDGCERIARRHGLEIWVDDEWGDPVTYLRVAPEPLLELLSTPVHSCWQEEHWPFHCGAFCAYLGHWTREDFERQAPGSGRAWYTEHHVDNHGESWAWIDESFETSVYRCRKCGKHMVYTDSD